jgi:16S rRNA (adenine1518-N6/adenine1519-N6)-dimethyltransferase
MLRQSLRTLPQANAMELLTRAGIDPTQRAEEIDVQGFVTLSQAYAQQLRSSAT